MKASYIVLLFALTIFTICSCKKDDNTNKEKQTHLTKFTVFGANNTSAFPNLSEQYYYDSLDRLQSIITNIDPPPPGAVIQYPDTSVFYYYGVDTLPFKAVHFNKSEYSTAQYFTYDAQARIITFIDSNTTAGSSSSYELDYSYLPNQIIITGKDTLNYDGNNITQNTGSRVFNIKSSNVQNPFNLVSINRHIPYNFSNLGATVLNKNAPVQIIGSYQDTLEYKYDNIVNGFPRKASTTYNSVLSDNEYFYYK